MICRRLKKDGNVKRIVWFGSYGKDGSGKMKRAITNEQAQWADEEKNGKVSYSYSSGKQAIADSLTQRLNILKGELWFNTQYGLPLFDNNKSKGVIDSYVISIINTVPGVESIISIDSVKDKHNYYANIKIMSEYGEITVEI